ncbi:MAG: Sir2 silent information regulator family NAD-dependent deacetylase, partial [Treponema sp.]|nr:Sir2 silent information regulator family NAD-dependent deacetylase [Treponema sp.]
MIYPDSNIAESLNLLKASLGKTEALIIGAGAGLSAAAGLPYDNADIFNALFPGYHGRYGLKNIDEADFYPFPTPEEQYAYWVRHISAIRYNYPPGKPYLDLHRIVKDKNHVILTTNIDGQFFKSGFDTEKICFPQGDLSFFQCSTPCTDELYPNEQTVKELLTCIGDNDFSIPAADIPHCPHCDSPLIPNVRRGKNFVGKPWMKKYQMLNDFLDANRGKKMLFLELGVGFTTPGIIRNEFEFLFMMRKYAEMIR